MTTRETTNSGITANKRLGKLKYLAGKAAPSVFGHPYHVAIELRRGDGSVELTKIYNTVTSAGKSGIADQILAAPSLGKPTHMAIGTGTGGTTTLNAELDRNALTSKTRTGAVVTMVGDWVAGDGTGALTEAGVLTAGTGGDLWLYTTYAVVNKGAADGLTITWTLTIS